MVLGRPMIETTTTSEQACEQKTSNENNFDILISNHVVKSMFNVNTSRGSRSRAFPRVYITPFRPRPTRPSSGPPSSHHGTGCNKELNLSSYKCIPAFSMSMSWLQIYSSQPCTSRCTRPEPTQEVRNSSSNRRKGVCVRGTF